MKNIFKSLVVVFFAALFCVIPAVAQTQNFEAGKNTYLLNGKPFVVRAGELHYTRIPRQDRKSVV